VCENVDALAWLESIRGCGMFGRVIVAHRQRLGLTQEALAEKAGLATRSLRELESGRVRVPRNTTVGLLADAFGLRGEDREQFCRQAYQPVESPADGRPADGGRAAVVPAQLPADVAGFTGRGAELARLDTLLTATAGAGGSTAVVISAVSGTAGVGKTALAIHWAHRVADRFPDGQLYVNLRGYDPDQPMNPADALARFLAALGVAGPDIPLDADERAACYRTQVAGRRMLIVLDNAATVEQVRPLLPGTAACAVVVTSRDSLAGLVAVNGAHRLDLDLLALADAIALLRQLIGARVEAEPDAVAALAALCGRLPLALRLAAELAHQQRRLELLEAGDDPRAAVRSVFSWSVRNLPPEAARTFTLLGLHPGLDLDAYAAAALTDTTLAQARKTLDQLARAHLIHPTTGGRYGMHDLLRAYAARLAAEQDSTGRGRAPLGRLFDYYLAAAAAAMNRLHPAEGRHRPRIPPPATPAPALADPDTARKWLDIELPSLVAVATHTATNGWPAHTVGLSATLYRYLNNGHSIDALAIYGHARDAARQAGDRAGEAQALVGLGLVHLRQGRHEQASEHLQRALTLFGEAGDPIGQARALNCLGLGERRLCRYGPAAEHHRHALALFRQAGDPVGEAGSLINLGNVERRLGHYGPAAEHHRQALALFRQAGDQAGEAIALANLGDDEMRLGRYRLAAEHLEHALALVEQLGNRDGEAWALSLLGTIQTSLGRPEQATQRHQRALAIFRDIGDHNGEACALNGLGEAARTAGHSTEAIAHHTAALGTAADFGARDEQARAHTGLGHAHRSLGEIDRASEHYEHALALHADLDMPDTDDLRAHLTATRGS
jgi:tetratricopeptide (TPR) repeat protein/transcriptional regulator with XRE-family HTH domain